MPEVSQKEGIMSPYTGTFTTTQREQTTLTYEMLMCAFDKFKNLPKAPPPIRIIKSLLLTKPFQTKYPKKRKNRRWVKKYRKKYTIQIPSNDIYFMRDEGILVCHPANYKFVKKAIESGKRYNGKDWI